MKKILVFLVVSFAVLALSACSKEEAPKVEAPAAQAQAPVAAKTAGITGTVLETMNAAGYTYVQVDDGQQKVWAAAPEFNVAVGDNVIVPDGMLMNNYHSKSLDRDFDVVYFVDAILNPNATAAPATAAATPEGPAGTKVAAPATVNVDLSGITKAMGGKTVAEIYAGKAELAGKDVVVHGKVVKYNAQIMGKNWLHVQDGSGNAADGSNDITITTTVEAKVGDTVLITGPVTLDKDFGYGYKYALIIEDAKVTVE